MTVADLATLIIHLLPFHLFVSFKFKDSLVQSFGQKSRCIFLIVFLIELELHNLVFELSKIGVFLDEREDSAKSLVELDQTDTVFVQDLILIGLHNGVQNSPCFILMVISVTRFLLHTTTLVHQKDEVSVSKPKRLH